MTFTGKKIELQNKLFGFKMDRWIQASENFARGASGEVHVFQNAQGVRLRSIWATMEYPVLKNNPNVNIIYHLAP